ncbi:MAG: hypothetical protein ACTHOH_17210 [Lysobacteraceae bacterium]
MKKGILAVIAVVVVLGLLGLGWWLIRDRSEETGPAEAVAHSPSLTPEQRADGLRKSLEAYRHWWREASYVEIRQAALDGDRVAQRRLSEVYEDCAAFGGALAGNLRMLSQLNSADPASQKAIQAVFDAKRICVQAEADLQKTPNLATYWLHRSAKAGDLVAQIRYVGRSTQQIGVGQMRYFIEETRNSGDPAAMFEIATVLPRMRGRWPEAAQADAFNGALGQQAWTLAACRAGFDCGRGSRVMIQLCVGMFACNQPDFASYYRTNRTASIDPAKLEAVIGIINRSLRNPAAPAAGG